MKVSNKTRRINLVLLSFSFLFFLFFSLTLISAIGINDLDTSLGTFKKDSSVILTQNCVNSTYSNLSKVIYPNSTFAINTQTIMTKNVNEYNYTFSSTRSTGKYLISGQCNEALTDTSWTYHFLITESGESDEETTAGVILFLLIFFCYLLIYVGVTREEFLLSALGSFVLFAIAIHTFNNGIGNFANDNFMILSFTLVNWGIAAYFGLRSLYEQITIKV